MLDYYQTMRQPFAVLALDIDHFKSVNDNWGHDVGDRVIRQVAQTLRQSARQSDVVCRNGGEEFLMLLPNTPLKEAEAMAERIRISIADNAIETVGHISISIGVAEWDARRLPLESSLKRADDALYQAKNSGRNCTVVAKRAKAS